MLMAMVGPPQRSTFCICTLLLSLHISHSALPPGWEDELYCPSEHCLREKTDIPSGFVGPRSSFVECAHHSDKAVQPPIPWGINHGEEAKQKLIADGYHTKTCVKSAEPDVEDFTPRAPEHIKPVENPGTVREEGSSSFPSPLMLISGVLIAIFMVMKFVPRTAKIVPPTADQKASMEAARKERLDKLQKETEMIRGTDEWKAREKAAQAEAACVITPEQRHAAARQGRCGGNFEGNSTGSLRGR